MNPLPVKRASQLESLGPQSQWLVEELWTEQAVGILGGEPKCCKSFLALDVAVSVASGAACLRQFQVRRTGKVLLFPAEDSLAIVRQRLEGIACAAQVASLLSYLRELQRQFHLAILLVHHARKDSHSSRPGQALRGSSELHGWGDSNLYLRRKGSQLTLSTEHRAAPGRDHIPLQLAESGSTVALTVVQGSTIEPATPPTPTERVRQALAQVREPIPVQQLQKLCGIRTAKICSALVELSNNGEVVHDARGYQLKLPLPVSRPIDPKGNGMGNALILSSETEAGSAEEQPAEG